MHVVKETEIQMFIVSKASVFVNIKQLGGKFLTFRASWLERFAFTV